MPFTFMNRAGDRPDGAKPLLLADLRQVDWGLYEILTATDDDGEPQAKVGDVLARLIESAKRYPPALGLAREDVAQVFGDHQPTQAEFARAYGTALQTYLSRQHEDPFVLAQAMKDDGPYRIRGEWYWVLEVSGIPPLASWVSSDFYIRDGGMSDFDLTGQQLKRLGYAG